MQDIVELRYVFGLRVRKLRKQLRFTQEQLGQMVGMNRTRISRLEAGKVNVTFDTVVLLAAGLGTTPSELFENIDLSVSANQDASDHVQSGVDVEPFVNYEAVRL